MTTQALFREDAYLRECDAVVTQVGDDGVELDRTIFYPLGGGQASDTGFITTASGDTLTANFTGQFTPTVDGKLRGVLSATIVGGTGRYGDASGSYLFTLEFDPATFQSTATIAGLLRF